MGKVTDRQIKKERERQLNKEKKETDIKGNMGKVTDRQIKKKEKDNETKKRQKQILKEPVESSSNAGGSTSTTL